MRILLAGSPLSYRSPGKVGAVQRDHRRDQQAPEEERPGQRRAPWALLRVAGSLYAEVAEAVCARRPG